MKLLAKNIRTTDRKTWFKLTVVTFNACYQTHEYYVKHKNHSG